MVLGVSSGAGAAIARALAAAPGLDVFGVHRGNHAESAAAVARDVAARGRRAHFRVAEGGTWNAAQAGADELLGVAGPRSVSLFVHSLANASLGRLASGDKDQFTPAQVQKTFESMAHSYVYWVQALVARDLLAPAERGGAQLLALSNPLVESLVRNGALITATKATLEVYVKHLAYELGPKGHRANLLKFGALVTPAVEATFASAGVDNLTRVLARAIPAGRLATPEEVGRFVGVLASDAGRWFNGATIDFTGAQAQSLFDALLHPTREG